MLYYLIDLAKNMSFKIYIVSRASLYIWLLCALYENTNR